jgi:hypothetical protein
MISKSLTPDRSKFRKKQKDVCIVIHSIFFLSNVLLLIFVTGEGSELRRKETRALKYSFTILL